jgi:hypothetical protein
LTDSDVVDILNSRIVLFDSFKQLFIAVTIHSSNQTRLAEYILQNAFSEQKMTYIDTFETIVDRLRCTHA